MTTDNKELNELFELFDTLTVTDICRRFLLKHFGRRDATDSNITLLLELALIKSEMQNLPAHDSLLYVMHNIKSAIANVRGTRFVECYDVIALYYEHNNHHNKQLPTTSLDALVENGHDYAVHSSNNVTEYIACNYDGLLHSIKTDDKTDDVLNTLEKDTLTESERKMVQRYFTRHLINNNAQNLNTKSRDAKRSLIELALTA